MLYFQIWQLKNADTRNFLLIFTFPITLLSLFDPSKLWPICRVKCNQINIFYGYFCSKKGLQLFGIFDMARLIYSCWEHSFCHVLPNSKKKKILLGCFKFDDLNLGLAKAIEILKATAYTILQCSLLAVLGLGLLLSCKDCFEPQCHLPLYFSPHHPMSFFMLKFSMALVPSFLCSAIFVGFLARIVLGRSTTSPTSFLPTTRCHFSC